MRTLIERLETLLERERGPEGFGAGVAKTKTKPRRSKGPESDPKTY